MLTRETTLWTAGSTRPIHRERPKNRLSEGSFATRPERGGYLDPSHYQDYADVLADYVLGFKPNMGVELYALSLQNEPSYDCDYESCDWTADQLHDFLVVLNREFMRKGVWAACPNLKITAPEDNNFRDTLLSAVYADPATKDLVHIAAGQPVRIRRLAVAAVNTNASASTITIQMDGAAKLGTLNLYRTSATEDMAAVGSVGVNGSRQVLELPPASISTFHGEVTP